MAAMDWKTLPLAKPSDFSWKELPPLEPEPAAKPTGCSKDLGRDWKVLPYPESQEKLPKRQHANVAAFHCSHWTDLAHSAKERKVNSYESNGMDPERLKKVLAAGGSCRNKCMEKVTFHDALGWCKAFHSAGEERRRMLIYSLYHPADSDFDWSRVTESGGSSVLGSAGVASTAKADRTPLQVNGMALCVQCFCSLLGIGRRSYYRMVHGEPDMRKSESGRVPRNCPQQAQVEVFFRDLYQSAAEPLATGLVLTDELLALRCCASTMDFFVKFSML